jgi:hypothetical protein
MAVELNISKETTHQILHEYLRKRKRCAKFVPHRLMDEETKRRLTHHVQTYQDSPTFSDCTFLLHKVKSANKGMR